jgi:hypothetical protein
MVNDSVRKEPLFTWKFFASDPKISIEGTKQVRPQPQHHRHQQPNTILPKYNTIHLSSSHSFLNTFPALDQSRRFFIHVGNRVVGLFERLPSPPKDLFTLKLPPSFSSQSRHLSFPSSPPHHLFQARRNTSHQSTALARPFEGIAALSSTLYHQYPNVDSSSSTLLVESPSPTTEGPALPPSCLSPSKDPTSGPHLR